LKKLNKQQQADQDPGLKNRIKKEVEEKTQLENRIKNEVEEKTQFEKENKILKNQILHLEKQIERLEKHVCKQCDEEQKNLIQEQSPMITSIMKGNSKDMKILLLGGWSSNQSYSKSCEMFDFESCWKSLENLPRGVAGVAALYHQGKVYVMGGWDGKSMLNSTWELDLNKNEWSIGKDLSSCRFGCSSVSDSKRYIYLIGGRDNKSDINLVERYNSKKKKWKIIGNLLHPRGAPAAVFDKFHEKIYVFGGGNNKEFLSTGEVYDVKEKTWKTLPAEMKVPRALFSAVFDEKNRRIFLIGGRNRKENLKSVECYFLEQQECQLMAEMNFARGGCSCVLIDNYIYVFGGRDKIKELDVVERYDIENNKWEIINNMRLTSGKFSCSTVLIPQP